MKLKLHFFFQILANKFKVFYPKSGLYIKAMMKNNKQAKTRIELKLNKQKKEKETYYFRSQNIHFIKSKKQIIFV